MASRGLSAVLASAIPARATFVKNHTHDIWCCDFVQAYDLLFRPLFLFFLVNQGSRKVVHVAATRNPTQEWTAQQLRNATAEGLAPRFLIRDRDDKFGATFDRVAKGAGTRVIKTAVRAPNMNPVGERFVGSLRREALDHLLFLDDQHLENVARQYVCYFNTARPHQGIGQRIPDGPVNDNHAGKVIAIPVLGGLHHDYRRAASSLAIPTDGRSSQDGGPSHVVQLAEVSAPEPSTNLGATTMLRPSLLPSAR